MTRSAVLAVNIVTLGDDGRTHLWRRGETVPPELVQRFGAHCFVGGDHVLRKAGARTPDQVRALAGAPAPTPVEHDGDDVRPGETYTVDPAEAEAPAASAPEADPGEPPRSGPGSSGTVWREYAAGLGQDVPSNAGRDAVIAQLVQEGLIDP